MDFLLEETKKKFDRILEVVHQDLSSVRTGKASPAILENVIAEAYGTKMKLVELATVTTPDPNSLLVTPFDIQNISAITKAIEAANQGLTAISEETHIRVIVPQLSEERRTEFVKLAKTKVEGGKIMLRQARHEMMTEVTKKNSDEDTNKRLEKEIQNLTDQYGEQLDNLLTEKERELMTV